MVNLNQFDTIIFDFGGVIFDIDPERTKSAFMKLYGKEKFNQVMESGLLWEFEKGEFTKEQLFEKIETITGISIDEEIFLRAWNAMLVDYKPKRIERIRLLAKSHKLLLLSNTNELHYEFFSNKLMHEYGVAFTDLFSKVYLSHEMGLIKPNLEFFKQVLIEQNLNPEKTLFIEDTKENAEAASKVGIETLLIPRNGNFYNYFILE
ncbi:MAG: HAD-IA family hydrolase [Salinivirgaceae bacterium]|jgi:HAD superfamily hydrolase (TIGR01509 family)|nr:HAD-IA family hydrolase [Salinivirgaceae bacterium]